MSVPRLRLDLRCRCLVAEGDLDFDLTSRNWRSKNGVDQRNVSFGLWRLTTLHSPPAPIWLTFWLAIRDGLNLIFVDHVAISRDFLIMLRFHEIFLFKFSFSFFVLHNIDIDSILMSSTVLEELHLISVFLSVCLN